MNRYEIAALIFSLVVGAPLFFCALGAAGKREDDRTHAQMRERAELAYRDALLAGNAAEIEMLHMVLYNRRPFEPMELTPERRAIIDKARGMS